MNNRDAFAFAGLFKDAYEKCFGHTLKHPLSEPESNHFSNEILEKTGLVIGWKSLKNYSHYILKESSGKSVYPSSLHGKVNQVGRRENPSIATLDTLARYLVNAPRTDEIQRKRNENHYSYWFKYKDTYNNTSKKAMPEMHLLTGAVLFAGVILLIAVLFIFKPFQNSDSLPADEEQFSEYFISLDEDSLLSRGWFVKFKDAEYWEKRNEKPEHFTLFTLRGDNWNDPNETLQIKNLFLRKIPFKCFTAEAHLSEFIPVKNWQQAGILLLEDTSFTGKSLRLSIAYNDFSGGWDSSREILIQAIASSGIELSKPEEIAHKTIFNIEPDNEKLITNNLKNSALRIEKQGSEFRLLFSNGPMENSAFREVVSREFNMNPKYICLFALKGFVNDSIAIPAYFKFFSLINNHCD